MKSTQTTLKGSSLVDSKTKEFDWYRTIADAVTEQEFQRKVYLTSLRLRRIQKLSGLDSPAGSK